jgi:tetratricopeptide (TPR) repeat protein
MLKKSLLLLFSLLLVLPVLAQDAEPEPTEIPFFCPAFTDASTNERTSYYMGEGAAFMRSGNYDSAVNAYGCVIQQIDSSYLDAYLNRAVAYTARRQYDKALEDYTSALGLDNNSVPVYNNRGVLYTATEEYELAMADFDRVISIDPNYAYGYINRGVLKAINGDLEAAEADFNQAIEVAGLDDIVTDLRNPERDPNAEWPAYDSRVAQAYALIGTIHSARALASYNDYLLLTGGRADERVRSAAGSLESRFQFELRFDDGSWMLMAGFDQQ